MRLLLASLLTATSAALPAQQFDTRGIPADAAIVVLTAPSTGLQINNSPEMKALEPVYQQCWPAVVDFIGDRMSPYARRAGEALAPRIGALMDLAFEQPRTLMHGDFRADNMMFEAGPSVSPFALVDWQIVMQGPAAFDLAYMLSGSLDVETRRARGE